MCLSEVEVYDSQSQSVAKCLPKSMAGVSMQAIYAIHFPGSLYLKFELRGLLKLCGAMQNYKAVQTLYDCSWRKMWIQRPRVRFDGEFFDS